MKVYEIALEKAGIFNSFTCKTIKFRLETIYLLGTIFFCSIKTFLLKNTCRVALKIFFSVFILCELVI